MCAPPPPPSTLPKHSYDPIYSWSGITLGGDGHVSSPRTTSTPSLASKYASTPVALWLASRRNCTPNLRNSASRSQKIQNQVLPLGWEAQRAVHPVHVWHIWLPVDARSDNRFLSVFRWIKLTRAQPRPNIALAWTRAGLLATSGFNTWVIWARKGALLH